MIVLNLFAFFSVIVLLNRPLHGLVCGGGGGGQSQKKITANNSDIIQLANQLTPLL